MTATPSPTTVTLPAQPDLDAVDHDRFAHYVRKQDATRGYILGQAITALCGKTWIPYRDPERYPICPTCAELRAMLRDPTGSAGPT